MPTDDVASLNFGQKDDAIILSYVFETLCKQYPFAKIMLYAECLGGLRVMNWLGGYQNRLDQLVGLILESPLPSIEHMLSCTRNERFNRLIYQAFCLLIPNFNAQLDRYNCYKTRRAQQFPNVPLLVGVLTNDWLSGPAQLPLWTARFTTTLAALIDPTETPRHMTHGHLFRSPSFQQRIHTFYNKYTPQSHAFHHTTKELEA
jgi:hypothetical protein